MTTSAAGLAVGASAAAAAGIAAYLFLKPKTSTSCPGPTCGTVCCPENDVCPNSNGVCPTGYEADENYPGCCVSTTREGEFLFEISGQSGSVEFTCPCELSSPDLVFQCVNATPNGLVSFYISSTDGNWQTLDECLENGCPALTATADAYGNVSLPVYSCQLIGSGGSLQPCAFNQPNPNVVYLVAYDNTSKTYSDVIVMTATCEAPCGTLPFCCAEVSF